MEIMNVASLPIITTAVYLFVELYKLIFQAEKYKKVIPVVAACLGIVFGLLIYFVYPTMIPADNAVVAVLIGIVSGWAAVGVNQVAKQATKTNSEDSKDDERA